MEKAREIGKKWAKFTKNTNGNFIRYKDGDEKNEETENLEEVSAMEAMKNIEWVVDWTMPLTKEEIEFVRANTENFIKLLQE